MRFLPLVAFCFHAQLAYSQSSSGASASGSASASASALASASGAASASAKPSPSGNSTASHDVITTTITSMVSSGSASPTPTTFVLTLTLNSSAPANTSSVNSTIAGNTTVTNTTAAAWNETDAWLPFHVRLDPAYGVLGAVLIISGVPVAGLGGKNRWSSLAIVSGYSLMLFTLVMILCFGVEPDLQPPSPNPPSQTLRGLYLLACLITAFIGAAIGIFVYKFAKYWICATGGFSLGWFLLATKSGGLISSVLGRWGLLGGLTVASFVGGLVPILHEHMILLSTALVGATAVTLGIDCYTRAGLKEFYVYNLGFHSLFPALNGLKYPLLQTMEIELGVLGAIVVIGGAIQFRLLNILQKRMKQMREEEEARIDAEEVAKAAERFKNLGSEMNEWEEKHGKGATSGASTPVTPLFGEQAPLARMSYVDAEGFDSQRRPSSTLSLLRPSPVSLRHTGDYDAVGPESPPLTGGAPTIGRNDTPTISKFEGLEEFTIPDASPAVATSSKQKEVVDPELESKMRLLEEVKKARAELRGSIDRMRAATPTPSILSRLDPVRSGAVTPTATALGDDQGRRLSNASSQMLDRTEAKRVTTPSEWDTYVSERKIITPPPVPSPGLSTRASMQRPPSDEQRSSHGVIENLEVLDDRRERVRSMHELSTVGGSGYSALHVGQGSGGRPRETSRRSMQEFATARPQSQLVPLSDRPADSARRSTYHENLGAPVIIGSAASSRPSSSALQPPPKVQRSMTYEELTDRHRKRLSELQNPLTSKMKEEVDIAQAKAKWEAQKRREKAEMANRERARKPSEGETSHAGHGHGTGRGRDKMEVLKTTDEWRRSVSMDADGFKVPPPPRQRQESSGRVPDPRRGSSYGFPS